jgi:GNAT superfamily N-acetyltransferase
MFTLAHLDSPPPESLKSQVLQMVVDYFSDISPVPLTSENPLYQLYQYVIGYEVHLYLQSMAGAQAGKPRLTLALADEDPSTVLGFALYLPYVDDPDACALLYMAVDAAHRRHGIGRAMLDQMQTRHPHAQVACTAGKAPYFGRLGFQALSAHGPQVLMNSRHYPSNGTLAVQDLEPIYQSTEVRQIHTYLLKQHGAQAMTDAEEDRDQLLDQLAVQARTLIGSRPSLLPS